MNKEDMKVRILPFLNVSPYEQPREVLEYSYGRYRDLVESSTDLIWSIDKDGHLTFVNRRGALNIYGYEPEEMIGHPFTDFETKKQAQRDLKFFAKIQNGEPNYHYQTVHLRKDGSPVYLSCNAIISYDDKGNVIGTMGTARDITERKEVERERVIYLRRIQRQQSSIVRLATNKEVVEGNFQEAIKLITEEVSKTMNVERVGIWLLDDYSDKLECVDLYELSEGAHSCGMTLLSRKFPRYFKALETGRAVDAHDAKMDERTSELNDPYLIPLGITSMLDAAIRINGSVVGIVCHEHVGERRQWKKDEVVFAGEVADQIAKVLLNNERKVALQSLKDAHDDLEERVKERTAALMEEISKRKECESNRKELQAQVLQAEKLSSIGLLASGVAHELNNPLTGLASLIRTYRRKKQSDPGEYDDLSEMLNAADHMSGIVDDLMTFSKVAEGEFVELDLNQILSSTLSLSTSLLATYNIKVVRHLSDKIPAIRGNRAQLQQAVLTLITNAKDAMPNGGQVTIKSFCSKTRDTACFSVEDTGHGIEKDFVTKVFDPFFTTKVVGKGMGLGLSVLHGIIKHHKGEVLVESQVEKGTVFTIMLPSN